MVLTKVKPVFNLGPVTAFFIASVDKYCIFSARVRTQIASLSAFLSPFLFVPKRFALLRKLLENHCSIKLQAIHVLFNAYRNASGYIQQQETY